MMKKFCPVCGGSGTISSFKGVSRFLLSTEECPECAGIGIMIPDAQRDAPDSESDLSPDKKDKT